MHSYIAYIDESGDDGLQRFREPGRQGGASKWLAISACILRATNDLEAVNGIFFSVTPKMLAPGVGGNVKVETLGLYGQR